MGPVDALVTEPTRQEDATSGREKRPAARRSRRLNIAGKWTAHRLLMAGLVILFVFPFAVMLTSAFKNPGDIFHSPPRLLPSEWTLDNFTGAFAAIPVWRYLGNTLFISTATVIGTVLTCPLVAYSLSKLQWRGRSALLAVVLSTMMLPPQVTMIPIYLMWNAEIGRAHV